LRSEFIIWDTATGDWKLSNVVERFVYGDHQKITRTLSSKRHFNFRPQDIRNDDYFKDRLTTSELNDFIKMEEIRGSEDVPALLVERYSRDAIPVSIIILTLIGATLASRKTR